MQHPSRARISTLSLHDALPISWTALEDHLLDAISVSRERARELAVEGRAFEGFSERRMNRLPDLALVRQQAGDRKSTRLNSSHLVISYAVFCLKKKSGRTRIVR